jgi:hypothetical protein
MGGFGFWFGVFRFWFGVFATSKLQTLNPKPILWDKNGFFLRN